MQIISPNVTEYYFGRILRTEAESILNNSGLKNGLFLLRDSMIQIGSFALSLCFENSIYHYKIDRLANENVKIDKGKEFIGPIEMINFFKTTNDNTGLCVRPIYNCIRQADIKPVKYLFISSNDLNVAVQNRIKKSHSSEIIDASDRSYYKYEKEALADIHFSQKWCLKDLDSKESEIIFLKYGQKDGKFLLRYKKFISITYKLSVCYKNRIYHHKIIFDGDKYYLEEEKFDSIKKFDYIAQLIDSYGRDKASLECKILMPYYDEDNNKFKCDSNKNYESLINQLVVNENRSTTSTGVYTGLNS